MSYQAFEFIKKKSRKNNKMVRQMVNDLDYNDIKFPVSKKDYGTIERIKASALMCLVIKMIWFIQFMYQMNNLKIL